MNTILGFALLVCLVPHHGQELQTFAYAALWGLMGVQCLRAAFDRSALRARMWESLTLAPLLAGLVMRGVRDLYVYPNCSLYPPALFRDPGPALLRLIILCLGVLVLTLAGSRLEPLFRGEARPWRVFKLALIGWLLGQWLPGPWVLWMVWVCHRECPGLPSLLLLLLTVGLFFYLRPAPWPNSGDCKANLKNLATAVEMYSTDYGGRFPPRLSYLTPNYLKALPACPAAGVDSYSVGYRSSSCPDRYDIFCHGRNHEAAYISAWGYPQYNSTTGLIERP